MYFTNRVIDFQIYKIVSLIYEEDYKYFNKSSDGVYLTKYNITTE